MKNIMLKTKKISVSTWKEFQEILLKKEINCELEWRRRIVFTKPCLPEESNYIKVLLVAKNGEKTHIMTVTSSQIHMSVNKCETHEVTIICQALKSLDLVIPPSLLIPVILSSIHFILLSVVFFIALANIRYSEAGGIMALCIISFTFLSLGIWRIHTSVCNRGFVSKLGQFLFIIGFIATIPVSYLQIFLFHAYPPKCSFLFVDKHNK